MEQELATIKLWVNKIWYRSMIPVATLLIGVLSGSMYVEGRVLDDCKYSNGFRVGTQSFTCTRKI